MASSKTIAPASTDAETARRLEALAGAPDAKFQLLTKTKQGAAEPISLTASAVQLLASILAAQARGESVTLLWDCQELTTHQAAKVLNVSRPFLIEQLNRGLIPYRMVGTHRRVLLSDVLAYQRANERHRLEALEALGSIDQELGLGYGP